MPAFAATARCAQRAILAVAGLILLLVAAALLSGCSGAAPAANKVRFNMAWLPQGSQVGVIVAIDKGFYRDAGLEVEAVRGFGGIRTANEVDQGMFEFGYGDPVSIALNRANGGTARLIGAINERWPGGLCFLREQHVLTRPADLVGLKVGGGQTSAVQVLLPVWLERNGVDPSSVQILQLNPTVIVASLVQGKIDAAECWRANSRPLFEEQARRAGKTLDWLEYEQFNLDIYGSGLMTSDRLIRKNPDLVKHFIAATYRGYRYALQHQQEALAIMLKRYPLLDAGVTAEQIRELAQLMPASDTSAGELDPSKMTRTFEFIASGYPLQGKVSADDLYTRTFVAAAAHR
ncbi:MAG: ABC transporter substrate-binding protein [Proteobacteria bacterium]|nr:ABC transporter substrate-binding protein [Pseudomonadota bacterium]